MYNSQIFFVSKDVKSGKIVDGTYGNQAVLAHLKHQNSHYVLIVDKNTKTFYINKLKTAIMLYPYVSDNFIKIEDDIEWQEIYNILKTNDINIEAVH